MVGLPLHICFMDGIEGFVRYCAEPFWAGARSALFGIKQRVIMIATCHIIDEYALKASRSTLSLSGVAWVPGSFIHEWQTGPLDTASHWARA